VTAALCRFDLAVVGAGIVGLAHAFAAARRGLRVVVLDRDAQANGASIRNFGFVTVTGQQAGACWRRAMRSRDVWAELAPRAGIRVEHAGLLVAARRPEAMAVLEAFRRTRMGEDCELLTADAARARCPPLADGPLAGALWSPHELRVESREAVPLLARWLESELGVTFRRQTLVRHVAPPHLETSGGAVEAAACVVCPGDDFLTLFPERLAPHRLTRCKLHMLRTAAQPPGWRLPGAVMSDLSLVRYLGYAELPEAGPLRRRLEREEPDALAHGVHLIVVQGADGSLVVGDSHHHGASPDPFQPDAVDEIILGELDKVLRLPDRRVAERWTGTYASAPDRLAMIDRPSDEVRLVVVTSGIGASTAFAIGEEMVGELFGPA
jgi:FAD dependent oxidoreductase TIGR03364